MDPPNKNLGLGIFKSLIKKEKQRRKHGTLAVRFNLEIEETYQVCMVKGGSFRKKKSKKKKKMTTRTTMLEFDPDYAPMSITVPGYRGKKYDHLKTWDEGESEEIPWWEMPDLDEEDELTGLIKKVQGAGDYDKKSFQKNEIYQAYSGGTTGTVDAEEIDLAANRVEGMLYKFALKMRGKIEGKVKEDKNEKENGDPKKRQSLFMSTYNWTNKDLWASSTDFSFIEGQQSHIEAENKRILNGTPHATTTWSRKSDASAASTTASTTAASTTATTTTAATATDNKQNDDDNSVSSSGSSSSSSSSGSSSSSSDDTNNSEEKRKKEIKTEKEFKIFKPPTNGFLMKKYK